jgi:hypothetical protein
MTSIEAIEKHLETITEINQKIIYLINTKAEYEKYAATLPESMKKWIGDNAYSKQCDALFSKYEMLLKYQPAPTPAPKPIRLIKSLSENQQIFLYNKLTENSLFLPIDSDFVSFCFVFGNSLKPNDFKPLQWMQNKQLLRELITELKHPDIEISKNRYILPAFFIDEKQKTILYLPTNKIKSDILSTKIVEISKKMRQTK